MGANDDANEVFKHEFFNGINKSKLLNKEIKSPYIPHIAEIQFVDKEEDEYLSGLKSSLKGSLRS